MSYTIHYTEEFHAQNNRWKYCKLQKSSLSGEFQTKLSNMQRIVEFGRKIYWFGIKSLKLTKRYCK